MKKIFFVIVIISFLLVTLHNNLKGKCVGLAFKCHSTTDEMNINQTESITYSPFLIKL